MDPKKQLISFVFVCGLMKNCFCNLVQTSSCLSMFLSKYLFTIVASMSFEHRNSTKFQLQGSLEKAWVEGHDDLSLAYMLVRNFSGYEIWEDIFFKERLLGSFKAKQCVSHTHLGENHSRCEVIGEMRKSGIIDDASLYKIIDHIVWHSDWQENLNPTFEGPKLPQTHINPRSRNHFHPNIWWSSMLCNPQSHLVEDYFL